MTEAADQPATLDIGALVGELRERVAQREREGFYPPGLTEQLDEHFRRIVGQRSTPDLDELRRRVWALDEVGVFRPDRISTESGMPGGQRLHAAVARLVSRQTEGVLHQVQEFSDAVRVVLRDLLAAVEDPQGHVHPDLLGQVDALYEHVAALERGGHAVDRDDGLSELVAGHEPVLDVATPADLAQTADASLGGVAVDGAARFSPTQMAELVSRLHAVLQPGGVAAVAAGREASEVRFLFEDAGFAEVRLVPTARGYAVRAVR